MKYLVMALLLISCSKSIENTQPMNKSSSVLASGYLVRDLDSTMLSITLEPNVVCYAYKKGETFKPCNIFVYATVHLSKPLKSQLHGEWKKEDPTDPGMVVLVLAPNSLISELNTGFSNHDNQNVPDNVRLGKITFVPVKD